MAKIVIVLLLGILVCADAAYAAAPTAGQLISVAEDLTGTGNVLMPVVDVRKFSEVSILGIANDSPTIVVVYFLSEATGVNTATPKMAVGTCEISTVGLPIHACITTSGESVQAFKVGGPFLQLVLTAGAEQRTVTIRVWAK
jgi:hypothetical protein